MDIYSDTFEGTLTLVSCLTLLIWKSILGEALEDDDDYEEEEDGEEEGEEEEDDPDFDPSKAPKKEECKQQ